MDLATNESEGDQLRCPRAPIGRGDPCTAKAWLTLCGSNTCQLAAFRSAVDRASGADLLSYFDRSLTVREIDAMSDALAAELYERGLRPGDRIATYLQNVPQYVIALLSTWKLGAALVPLNPMLRSAELEYQLNDSGAKALIALDTLWEEVATTSSRQRR